MKLMICALNSSNSGLSLWINAGRNVIDYIWSSNRLLAIRLSGSLLSVERSGFKQFVLPHIVKSAQLSLQSDSKEERVAMLYLISRTCKVGILSEAYRTWKTDLVKWAVNEGTHFQLSESSVSILISQLELYIKTPMM